MAVVARRYVARQCGQQLGGDGAEKSFALPAATGHPGVEWISCIRRSAQTWLMWVLVKSAP